MRSCWFSDGRIIDMGENTFDVLSQEWIRTFTWACKNIHLHFVHSEKYFTLAVAQWLMQEAKLHRVRKSTAMIFDGIEQEIWKIHQRLVLFWRPKNVLFPESVSAKSCRTSFMFDRNPWCIYIYISMVVFIYFPKFIWILP